MRDPGPITNGPKQSAHSSVWLYPMELPAGVHRFAISRHVFKHREYVSDQQPLNRRVADRGVKPARLRTMHWIRLEQQLRNRSERIDALWDPRAACSAYSTTAAAI